MVINVSKTLPIISKAGFSSDAGSSVSTIVEIIAI